MMRATNHCWRSLTVSDNISASEREETPARAADISSIMHETRSSYGTAKMITSTVGTKGRRKPIATVGDANEALGQAKRRSILAEQNERGRPANGVLSKREFPGELKQVCKSGRDIMSTAEPTLIRSAAGEPRPPCSHQH